MWNSEKLALKSGKEEEQEVEKQDSKKELLSLEVKAVQ